MTAAPRQAERANSSNPAVMGRGGEGAARILVRAAFA